MSTTPTTYEYDLYLDESGQFLEASSDPKQLQQAAKQKKIFPSQFAGFLVRRGDIREEAEKVFQSCKQAAYLRPNETFKGATLQPRQLASFISKLI